MKYRSGTVPTYGIPEIEGSQEIACMACRGSLGEPGAAVVHGIGAAGWEGSLHVKCAPAIWDEVLGPCPECGESGYPTDGGPPGWRACPHCGHTGEAEIENEEEEWLDSCGWCGGRVLREIPRIVETTRGYEECNHNPFHSPPCGRIDYCDHCGEMIYRGDPIVDGVHEKCAQEIKNSHLEK